MKKIAILAFIILFCFSILGPNQFAQASAAPGNRVPWRVLNAGANKIDPALQKTLASAVTKTTVIVTLRQQADLSQVGGTNRGARLRNAIQALQSTANATQGRLRMLLTNRRGQGAVSRFEALWIMNGFSVTASSAVITELGKQADVLSITPDDIPVVPATLAAPEPNIAVVNAPALWNLGFYGQGVVVASMDSGVDVSHPDLSARWRGGTNSWFDPYNQHPATPTDMSGHGTWTMGVLVGGDAGGTTIGVAPSAQWISVKIFNDAGSATATAIHKGFQWLLDPDGNPNTDDAPQVVNNSWTYGYPGCNLEFEPDMQALRAAGILPVFAAGNGGPSAGTSYSPANNPSAFAVGAVNNSGLISSLSSRGPSACGGTSAVFPDVVAPGVNILTSDLFGGYYSTTGTSLAAPHVAGGLALLLSAYPNLSTADQESALINSATDLGAAGPDNVYGHGEVNLLAAYNWLVSAPTATSTSEPTFTATPQPFTATPTATALLPTATSLPPTATTTPTATPTSAAPNTLHSGDLDRTAVKSGTKWTATITILVHNASEQPVANATVSAKWTNGTSGTATCVTNASGLCAISKTGLNSSVASITFTVTKITLSPFTYSAAFNHDPDGDSNGTTIVVSKP